MPDPTMLMGAGTVSKSVSRFYSGVIQDGGGLYLNSPMNRVVLAQKVAILGTNPTPSANNDNGSIKAGGAISPRF